MVPGWACLSSTRKGRRRWRSTELWDWMTKKMEKMIYEPKEADIA